MRTITSKTREEVEHITSNKLDSVLATMSLSHSSLPPQLPLSSVPIRENNRREGWQIMKHFHLNTIQMNYLNDQTELRLYQYFVI